MSKDPERDRRTHLAFVLLEWRSRFLVYAGAAALCASALVIPSAVIISHKWSAQAEGGSAAMSAWPIVALVFGVVLLVLAATFIFGAVAAHATIAIMDLPVLSKEQRNYARTEQMNWYGSSKTSMWRRCGKAISQSSQAPSPLA